MNTEIKDIDWGLYPDNMLLNVSDIKYYYSNITKPVMEQAESNKLAIATLDGRVTKVEQEIPVGPGGTGAYLNLGGTPDRYPTAEEMVSGDSPEPTSFIVVARQDGIYFYNPKSKLLIPPKKGGGTIAVHGQFPQIFDEGHSIQHEGRVGLSGVYTAKTSDVGLGGGFLSYNTTKILVVVTKDEEYHTAMHPDGVASRIFPKGTNTAPWSFHNGGGTGGSIDPIVIQEINRRLEALESIDPVDSFIDLKDVVVDNVRDVNGLLYLGEDGKVRGGTSNPMLSMGYAQVHSNSVGTAPVVSSNSIGAISVASSNTIVTTSPVLRTITLPNVTAANSYKPATTEVREGRITYIVNTSNITHTIRVSSTNMFYRNGGMDSTNMEIPPKTVYTYVPALIDNGSGAIIQCWVFMGSHPLSGSELADILLEIEDLKTKNDDQQSDLDFIKREMESGKLVIEGLQNANIDLVDRVVNLENPNFLGLTDSPNSFTGQAGMLLKVNDDESGLEYTIDSAIPIMADLEMGNIPIKWNNMKQKIAASSSDITQGDITENAFTLGLGGTASRKYTLPDIVDADTNPLPANSVREGRLTVISQQGGGNREVVLSNGCKFASAGVTSTTAMIIPPGESWMLLPAIYGNGDKCWSIIGTFSANPMYSNKYNGYNRTGVRSINALAHFSNSQINQANLVHTRLAGNNGSTLRYCHLPDIVSPTHSGWLENHQVRHGRELSFTATGSANMILRLAAGQQWWIGGVTSTADRTLVPGIIEKYIGIHFNGVQTWFMLSRTKIDGTSVGFSELQSRVTTLEGIRTSFSSLPDTPSAYHPGKLLGYNMAGDALVPVDPINNFRAMTDTPNDYTTHRRKAIVVKDDESGLEFATMPNIAPLQTEVNNLYNDIINLQNRVTVLEAKPFSQYNSELMARIENLEALVASLTKE